MKKWYIFMIYDMTVSNISRYKISGHKHIGNISKKPVFCADVTHLQKKVKYC